MLARASSRAVGVTRKVKATRATLGAVALVPALGPGSGPPRMAADALTGSASATAGTAADDYGISCANMMGEEGEDDRGKGLRSKAPSRFPVTPPRSKFDLPAGTCRCFILMKAIFYIGDGWTRPRRKCREE